MAGARRLLLRRGIRGAGGPRPHRHDGTVRLLGHPPAPARRRLGPRSDPLQPVDDRSGTSPDVRAPRRHVPVGRHLATVVATRARRTRGGGHVSDLDRAHQARLPQTGPARASGGNRWQLPLGSHHRRGRVSGRVPARGASPGAVVALDPCGGSHGTDDRWPARLGSTLGHRRAGWRSSRADRRGGLQRPTPAKAGIPTAGTTGFATRVQSHRT